MFAVAEVCNGEVFGREWYEGGKGKGQARLIFSSNSPREKKRSHSKTPPSLFPPAQATGDK
jgi:hypothetical protein